MANPTELLLAALVSHGFGAKVEDGWIVVEGSRAVLRASSQVFSHGPKGTVVRLDVQTGLPDGRLLTESNGAAGKDEEEATAQCLGKFVMGSLHPLLGAFFGHREHQEIERWTLGGTELEAFIGPLVVQAGEKSSPPPPKILDEVKKLLGARPPSRAAHWVRIFYSAVEKGDETHEALLDGEPWPEMLAAMKGLSWPKAPVFFSARLFLVLAPTGAPDTGVDYRSLERAVRAFVDVCAKDRALNDELVVEKLRDREVDPALAERLVTFVPLGFSEVLLQGCKLSPDYQIMGPSNETVTRRLADEPVFVAAREVAASLRAAPDGKDPFMAVVTRCSRFQAANEALSKGSKLEDLVFAPPVVFLREPEPPRKNELPPPPRPWWKVW